MTDNVAVKEIESLLEQISTGTYEEGTEAEIEEALTKRFAGLVIEKVTVKNRVVTICLEGGGEISSWYTGPLSIEWST